MPLVHHRISIVMCCRTSRSITDSQYIHQPLPEILYTPHVFEINIDKSYMQCVFIRYAEAILLSLTCNVL